MRHWSQYLDPDKFESDEKAVEQLGFLSVGVSFKTEENRAGLVRLIACVAARGYSQALQRLWSLTPLTISEQARALSQGAAGLDYVDGGGQDQCLAFILGKAEPEAVDMALSKLSPSANERVTMLRRLARPGDLHVPETVPPMDVQISLG